jgi:hypothetical protein
VGIESSSRLGFPLGRHPDVTGRECLIARRNGHF